MKKETIIQRLDNYANSVGINDNIITNKAGLSIGLLGKSRKGEGGLNSVSIEKILYAYPDISPEWLLTGKGSMLRKATQPVMLSASETSQPAIQAQPVILSGSEGPQSTAPCSSCTQKERIIQEKERVISLLEDKVNLLEDKIDDLKDRLQSYETPKANSA